MKANQIFRNDFVCIHYYLCEVSTDIIECKIFAPYQLYNANLSMVAHSLGNHSGSLYVGAVAQMVERSLSM